MQKEVVDELMKYYLDSIIEEAHDTFKSTKEYAEGVK